MLTELEKLTELSPARRNRYYYGKLMDVLHFTMEQRYVLSKEWLYNRAVLGPGVVCGLGVAAQSTSAGNGVVVSAGLAIDGWGREIIVPDDVTLLPLQLTDQCGQPSATTGPLPANVMVQLCYTECETDFGPTLVSDGCGCGDCEAGTIVESYCVRVVAGTGPAVTVPCTDTVMTGLKAGKLHDVMCALSQTCTAPPDDPCITLANVTVAADGTLTVDSVSPRAVAPTNRILAQLIACLADCCANLSATDVLRVAGVDLVEVKDPQTDPGTVVGTLDPPSTHWDVTVDPKHGQPNALDVRFTGATVDTSTVTLGLLPKTVGTFQVEGTQLAGVQLVFPTPNVARMFVKDGMRGQYRLRLVGTPEASSAQKAIMSQATSSAAASALDGELLTPPVWPSGEGQPGGDFGPIEINIS
jgi:hypothetical protein